MATEIHLHYAQVTAIFLEVRRNAVAPEDVGESCLNIVLVTSCNHESVA